MTKTAIAKLDEVFAELDTLLKNPEIGAELASEGVNISLAMTIVEGLRAYVHADKGKALLELGTATDEIAARMAQAKGSGQTS